MECRCLLPLSCGAQPFVWCVLFVCTGRSSLPHRSELSPYRSQKQSHWSYLSARFLSPLSKPHHSQSRTDLEVRSRLTCSQQGIGNTFKTGIRILQYSEQRKDQSFIPLTQAQSSRLSAQTLPRLCLTSLAQSQPWCCSLWVGLCHSHCCTDRPVYRTTVGSLYHWYDPALQRCKSQWRAQCCFELRNCEELFPLCAKDSSWCRGPEALCWSCSLPGRRRFHSK